MGLTAVILPIQDAFGSALQEEIVIIPVFLEMILQTAEFETGLVENQQRLVLVNFTRGEIGQEYLQGDGTYIIQPGRIAPGGQETASYVDNHDILAFSEGLKIGPDQPAALEIILIDRKNFRFGLGNLCGCCTCDDGMHRDADSQEEKYGQKGDYGVSWRHRDSSSGWMICSFPAPYIGKASQELKVAPWKLWLVAIPPDTISEPPSFFSF